MHMTRDNFNVIELLPYNSLKEHFVKYVCLPFCPESEMIDIFVPSVYMLGKY